MNVPREESAGKMRIVERWDTPAPKKNKGHSAVPAVVVAPAASSRADDEFEEDWYSASRENGSMVDMEQEIHFDGDEQMDEYDVAGRDEMAYGSSYLGESSEEVPKREERTSCVEFVEALVGGSWERCVFFFFLTRWNC